MNKEKSPFKNTTIHIKTIAKAAGEFKTATGRDAILAFQDCPEGKIRLCIAENGLSNIVYTSEPIPNWKVYAMLVKATDDARENPKRFITPDAAAKPTVFKVPHLSKETYQALIEELSDTVLCDLLGLFKDEYDHARVSNPSFRPEEQMRSEMDAVGRYIHVFNRHGGWELKPKRNLKVILKRYRMWVMQAVNKEYQAGTKVFPDKHGVLLV